MRRAALLLALLLGQAQGQLQRGQLQGPEGSSCAGPAAAPTRTRAVFVLDTSASMRGEGDGRADIFGRVKASIGRYVREQRPDEVELLTFDTGLRSGRRFERPAGSAPWNTALAAVRADGQNTHLYRSLQAALAPLPARPDTLTHIYVLTDGIDNDPARAVSPAGALSALKARGELDRLYYLALGADIPPEARAALIASPYAAGLRFAVGQVPDLARGALAGGVVQVADPARVPVPFADGTPLSVGGVHAPDVTLLTKQVSGGRAALKLRRPLPYGAALLLCAPPAGEIGGDPRRVLLRLSPPPGDRLTWLNPGADLNLGPGESVTLRYRVRAGGAVAGLPLDGATLRAGAGLDAALVRLPGARDFAVRLTNRGLADGARAQPLLALPGAPAWALPAVRGVAQGARTGWPLLGLAAAVALVLAGLWGRLAGPPVPRPRPVPARGSGGVPAVEGLEYSQDRTLALVGASGEVTSVPMPLGGPFDIGHLARVPHLSGLRAEQHRDGLRLIYLPSDLEVSLGTRLLRAGDVVRPGSLLGVAVARPARAPQPPVGSLTGLGLPLTLRCEDARLRVLGPYGDHAVVLGAGISDLGELLDAPALCGLRLSVEGARVLLLALPPGVGLRRSGEAEALRPGTYLAGSSILDFPPGVPS